MSAHDQLEDAVGAIEQARDLIAQAYRDDEHDDSPGNMAYALLNAALDRIQEAAQAERTRIVTRLVEMAEIIGDDEIARIAHTLMAAAAVIDAERPS